MKLSLEQKTQIEQQASVLLKEMQKYGDTFWGVNLNILAAHFGFDIYETEMPDLLQGDIQVDDDRRIIHVNINCPHELKRFIIAHEFGHFYTAGEENQNRLYIRESRKNIHCGKSIVEEEMDYFAACILMPEQSFRRAFTVLRQRNDKTISYTLAQLFNVPLESTVRRIDELNLVNE